MKLGPVAKADNRNKTTSKKFHTALTILLWVKALFSPKSADFFAKNMLTSAKVRMLWYYKLYFLKLNMCLYLHAEFEVSSIILTSFRQGVYLEILMHIQPHSQSRKQEKEWKPPLFF